MDDKKRIDKARLGLDRVPNVVPASDYDLAELLKEFNAHRNNRAIHGGNVNTGTLGLIDGDVPVQGVADSIISSKGYLTPIRLTKEVKDSLTSAWRVLNSIAPNGVLAASLDSWGVGYLNGTSLSTTYTDNNPKLLTPSNVTYSLYSVVNGAIERLNNHINSTGNVHNITAENIGLGGVKDCTKSNNESDNIESKLATTVLTTKLLKRIQALESKISGLDVLALLPIGTIMGFNISKAKQLLDTHKWVLCDGTNDTPDLTGYIKGAPRSTTGFLNDLERARTKFPKLRVATQDFTVIPGNWNSVISSNQDEISRANDQLLLGRIPDLCTTHSNFKSKSGNGSVKLTESNLPLHTHYYWDTLSIDNDLGAWLVQYYNELPITKASQIKYVNFPESILTGKNIPRNVNIPWITDNVGRFDDTYIHNTYNNYGGLIIKGNTRDRNFYRIATGERLQGLSTVRHYPGDLMPGGDIMVTSGSYLAGLSTKEGYTVNNNYHQNLEGFYYQNDLINYNNIIKRIKNSTRFYNSIYSDFVNKFTASVKSYYVLNGNQSIYQLKTSHPDYESNFINNDSKTLNSHRYGRMSAPVQVLCSTLTENPQSAIIEQFKDLYTEDPLSINNKEAQLLAKDIKLGFDSNTKYGTPIDLSEFPTSRLIFLMKHAD